VRGPVATRKPQKARRLTPRERRFVEVYLRNGGNASAASAAAGYSARDTSKGARQMAKPRVMAEIKRRMDEVYAKESMGTDEVLARIARLARVDVRKLFTANGDHVLPHQLGDEIAAAVRGIETELKFDADGAPPTAVRRYKLSDPMPALRTLAQIQRLLAPDAVAVNLFLGLDERLDRAERRLSGGDPTNGAGRVVSEQ
jgi:phage terminase small subunit